ncbi:Hypothetical protein CAP_7295 [Chondromyces apiculatus DSM 436]|uniref:DUF2169 domain-containing protein n=1 Tax=Chondromyces apiculatus DSM 436 TaxID=1192034 RepID=A0A017SZ30_9BACT|nr:Hypothetical protein CAP_7295 [Chondromyces apiculatus DSM 436]
MPNQPIETIPLESRLALPAIAFVWQAEGSRKVLTVVCKTTYELCPGVSPLAPDQDDVLLQDIHWAGDTSNSVWAPSDLVPFKRRVDVLVTGHAYPPPGQPVHAMLARLTLGAIDKAVEIYGDRSVLPGGVASRPAAISRVALCWERAAGGPGTMNPAGIAVAALDGSEERGWVPNLQPPGLDMASLRDPIPPAGMGPIAPDWPHRMQKLGRAAAFWDHRTWHAHPLPDEVDASYFNSAPADQQVDHLALNETLVLEHLHAEHPRLVTRLEQVVPHATLRRAAHPEQPIHLRCDTLWIDTDRGVCCVTWRGSVPLERPGGASVHLTAEGPHLASLTAERAAARGGQALTSEEPRPEGGFPERLPQPMAETITGGLSSTVQAPLLPFMPATVGVGLSATPSVTIRESRATGEDDDMSGTLPAPLVVTTKALPFGTQDTPGPVLPEQIARPGAPALLAPLAGPGGPTPQHPFSARSALVEPPPVAGPSQPVLPPLGAAPLPPPLGQVTATEDEPGPASESEVRTLPPPPLVNAGVMVPTTSEPVASQAVEPAASTIDPEAFTIERWAELTAEMDKGQRSRAALLRAQELTEVDLTTVERHWKTALDSEAKSGGFALRARHDTAYVGALERLRGRPLSAPEYARLLATTDRKQLPPTLQELEMPAAAHLPIVRLWTGKLARDPKLSFEMIQAVAALRGGTPGSTPAMP